MPESRVLERTLTSLQPPIEAVLATLLNRLDAILDEVVPVLDDYHVIAARDVRDGMAVLLAHPPNPPRRLHRHGRRAVPFVTRQNQAAAALGFLLLASSKPLPSSSVS